MAVVPVVAVPVVPVVAVAVAGRGWCCAALQLVLCAVGYACASVSRLARRVLCVLL